MFEIDFTLSNHISWQNVGNIVFIFDEINKGIMMLDEVTTDFWCYLEKGYTIDEVASKIIEEYNVNYTEVKNDILEFVKMLKKNNIIKN